MSGVKSSFRVTGVAPGVIMDAFESRRENTSELRTEFVEDVGDEHEFAGIKLDDGCVYEHLGALKNQKLILT